MKLLYKISIVTIVVLLIGMVGWCMRKRHVEKFEETHGLRRTVLRIDHGPQARRSAEVRKTHLLSVIVAVQPMFIRTKLQHIPLSDAHLRRQSGLQQVPRPRIAGELGQPTVGFSQHHQFPIARGPNDEILQYKRRHRCRRELAALGAPLPPLGREIETPHLALV